MPLPPAPAATLGVGAAANGMGAAANGMGAAANGMGPWVSIDAARAARALHERRHERKRGPSVAELTLQQHASAATQVHFVAHEWRASRARYSKRAGEDEEGELPSDGEPSTASRCGFSWDAAAVQCGGECSTGYMGQGYCERNGICFGDLPLCDHKYPAGRCFGFAGGVSDAWCVTASQSLSGSYLADAGFYKLCFCEETVIGPDTPIEPHDLPVNASDLPPRSDRLVAGVRRAEQELPGLPECTWEPGKGCSNVTQYECTGGPKDGECSGDNWFYRPDECTSSCVHSVLLYPAPYFAVWRPGPRARPWAEGAQIPHYAAEKAVGGPSAFDEPEQILMSTWCKSEQTEFVGVSFFSPAYEVKARRLLDSCNTLGVCCKATMLSADFMGPSAPEGSAEFRYRMIALKPSFLLDQLEKTQQPVVFLDVDLEFHKFPDLFLYDSWPDGPRDVALFNFWANETNLTYRHTPNIGSAVAYFNQTYRAKKLLAAWAEAMEYGTNAQAPDDQVLDTLLNEGGWMSRVSLGWLPASYLRLMPAFYRGVDPVIDHDRSSPPGLNGHSTVKPVLPPTLWEELVVEEVLV